MKKVFVVGRSALRDQLVEAVRGAGVLHLVPVDPSRAIDAEPARSLERLERGIAALEAETAEGAPPAGGAEDLAAEAVGLDKARAELTARQAAISQQLAELAPWGELRLDDVHDLHARGLHLTFVSVPRADLEGIRADVAQPLQQLPGGRVLVGVVSRTGVELPPAAEVLELPSTDRPTLRAEAEAIAARLAEIAARLRQLRHGLGALRDRAAATREQVELATVEAGGLRDDVFFGVQGWIPTDGLAALRAGVGANGLAAVVERDPEPDELPPTLLRPPAWARSVSGLMAMLGLSPGYREADVSVAFMVAVPLFAAMLISDAGYGALMALLPLVAYRRAVAAVGRPLTHFVVVVGVTSVAWGLATGSFFGLDIARLLTGGPPLITVSQDEAPMRLLMRISFTIGVVQLSLAQLWRAALTWPSLAFLGRVGWAAFLWGMYGVVTMFVLKTPMGSDTPWPYLLAGGAALAVLFAAPTRNVLKSVVMGLANFPLSALGTFSDIMSYVRLMAVGLAGSVLAVSFNELAVSSGAVMMVPILVFGHGLNIGLCLIALFAHGVRLNVLEFSNNFGLEWSGYPYRPFHAPAKHQES